MTGRNIILSISILAGCILAQSCSDFLKEKTTTSISESTIYASEPSLEAALYGVYSIFVEQNDANIVCKEMELLHSASGLYQLYVQSTPLTNIDYSCQYLKLGVNYKSEKSYTRYSYYYSAICAANRIIENVGGASVPEKYKNEVNGEAHLLRAFCYFMLVRCFGDVPLILKSPTTTAEANMQRTPFDEVYCSIVSDLKFAFENMRSYQRVCEVSGPAAGRPCNYAAQALLSEVYLTIGTLLAHPDDNFWNPAVKTPNFSSCGISTAQDAFRLSLEAAEDVIEHGPYSLAPTYARLFRWTVQEGDEPDQDWTLPERVLTINVTVKSGAFAYLAKYSLPNYPEGSGQTSISNASAKRWKPSRYVFQHWCETYPGEKGSDPANSNIYVSSSDPRLDATFYYDHYNSQKDGKLTVNYIYPSKNCVYVPHIQYEMCFKKYLSPAYNNNQGSADLYLLRYAGVLLNASEAAANLSGNVGDEYWNKSFDYMEQIHKRARTLTEGDGGTGSAMPKWDKDTRFRDKSNPKQELIDAIFWERVFETTLEGHEYYDTHRMGAGWLSRVIARPLEEFLKRDEQRYSNATTHTETYAKGYTLVNYGMIDYEFPSETDLRKSLLCGFPYYEMVNNPTINEDNQNPYYWE